MKIKIKQTFRSMWATILAVLMLLSTFTAVAVTLNKEDTGANVDINSTGWNTGAVTIYFDNTNTNWDTPYLIIGSSGWATRYTMERVSGTQYLWKYTFTSSVDSYGAYYFTKHSNGFAGPNENINKIAYMGSGDATHQIAQQMNNNDVYTPASTTTSHSYTDGSTTKSVNTYNVTTSTYATYNVTSSVTGTGSGTITLKDYDGNNITSGTSVPYLTVITATVTPDDGELSSFNAGGTPISSGDKVTIKSATSFNAVVNKAGLTVYFDNTNTKWTQPYLIYGNDSSATRRPLSRVSGTQYLWKYTFDSSVTDYTAFYFTSISSGYVETIHKIAYMSDKQATDRITGTMTNNGLYVPASDATAHTYVDSGNNNHSNTFNTYDLTTSSYTTYNVTSTVTGTGSGTITLTDYDGNPVESGSDVPILTVITATVTPDNGELSSFTAGGTDISSGDSVTINSDTSFDAIININQNPVATALSVSVTSSSPYYVNEPITLGHTEDSVESGATFEYAYTTSASPTDSDWITLDTNTFTPTSAGTYYFRVTASKEGFASVTSGNEAEVTVSNRMYNITKAETTNGSFDTKVNSVSVTEASAGATVTIKTNPDPGYGVANISDITVTITGNSGSIGSGVTVVPTDNENEYTFTMPEGSVTVNVTFSLKDYTMTGNANPSDIGGVVKCTNSEGTEITTANKGNKVTFTANTVSGYSVDSWTISGSDTYTVSSDKKSVEVTVETSDVTATANYVGDSYNVTQNASSNGTYTVTGVTAGKAQYGSTVIINPAPATGFALDSITVKQTGGTTTVPVTNNSFTMPAYDVTITVKFKAAPVDKGTLQVNYRVLYSTTQNPSTMTNVLSNSEVYLKDGVYTAYISGTDLDKIKALSGQFYMCISSDSTYQNMLCKGTTNPTTPTTETSDYVNSVYRQDYSADSTTYRYISTELKNKDSINQVTISYNSTNPQYIVNAYAQSIETKSLADGVTLAANPTTQTIGKNVTLTATLGTVHEDIPEEAEFTYTFYRGSEELGTVTRTNVAPIAPVKFTTTYNTAGDQSYTVTVSTSTSYVTDTYTPTDYESVTSTPVRVTYSDVVYYYAAVDPDSGNVNTREAIPGNNMVPTTVSEGGTYYFSVFDNNTDVSADSVVDFTVDIANNRYCTITKSSTETGLDYFIVKCNAKCSKPVIYFNKANKTVYAVATQNVGSSKTLDSEKKVTYYFAEEKYDSTDQSDPAAGGDGMRIKYWNNSVNNSTYTGYADVTTKVIRPGTDNNNKSEENNSIFVWVDKFPYPDGTTFPSTWNQNNRREFYIYSVDLPIWATSFSFVKANDTALTINNTSQISDNTTTASIVLNPNRVYCFLSFNYNNYVRGVVLDDSLWDGNARNTANSNEVATQGFASNIVNYKTVRNDTSGNVAFNTALTAKYGTDYKHPLYFNGWYGDNDNTIVNDTRTLYGSSYFRLHDNLAMRKSYFASVQNLTDNRLSTTKKNKMGNGYLLGYNGALMPLFDYEMLNDNKTTLVNDDQLYENVQFPFYASTFNGVTTYSYDSTTDRNRLVETTEDGKTTVNVSSSFVKNGNSYGYFPFGGTSDTNKYGSGTEFDINFYMTNNGKLSNGDDIAFNFSGDDDVWVYVDGVRVLDLGGAHSVSSGTINFSDMKVYYKTAGNATEKITNCNDTWVTDPTYVKTVSLKDLFEANGATFSNTDASTQHTLQMFYLERGQGESNCSISFNLPQNTGFRVNSNVTTDSVNKALVEDTMASANKDYFNYQIANKIATETEYNTAKAKFTNAHARVTGVSGLTPSTNPSYPIKSILISREFLGTSYCLTAPNATTQNSSDTGWLNSVTESSFTNLQNVNYTLSDAYAVKATSDDETSPSGRVSESGIFNLLFGQSALFESKIPNNTMIQLSQDDKISKVNAGVENSSVITAGDDSTKTVSDYYSSSYSIIDDNTGLKLANETQSVTEGKLYANDASANSNMFYFANYSGDATASSNAMTVTYTNDVLTSQIKLAKSVQNPSATDNFYFKVEFSKIFGEDLATAKEYPDLQYKVYNSDKTLFATRTYGKAGVYFTANQYAIIEGVPVDSAYKVVEKDRAGYKFVKASKTTYNGETAGDPVSYTENSVDGKTVSGAGGTTTYDAITFENKKELFTVNFKYYDRSVITGTTSHISTSPTTVTYSYADVSKYTTDDGGAIKYDLVNLIADAYANYNFNNLIDRYTSFTSQTNAINEAGNFKVIREGIDDVTPGVTTYLQAYGSTAGVDLGLHYDCYGRPQGTDGCKVSDGEEWVTYYNGTTKLTEEQASGANSGVTSITVWLYNTLKEYRPTFYYAPASASDADLKAVTGTTDRYVATTNKSYTISDNVYYNVRLGNANGNTQNDAATDYLEEYGISKGYCDEVPNITANVTDNNNNKLKFLYWASDPSGKTILSTDIAYGYRVTNDLKAYAVYGKTDLSDKGLTIIPNTPDYYSNSTGKAFLRLNNVMNVYNCPERDKNIKKASIIYIIDFSDNKEMDDLLKETGGFKALQEKVQEVLKANEDSKNFLDSEDIVIGVSGVTFKKADYGDIDITGFNHKVVPYNEALNPGTDDIKLTNKNRVQFTTSFTKSNLKELKMYAMLGMDYGAVVTGKNSAENSWIVSDNLLYYEFGAKSGDVASIKDPIFGYEFYKDVNVS